MASEPQDLAAILAEIAGFDTKTRETYVRAPFGWPGGKWQSLSHLFGILPKGKTLHDGCGGSGIVCMNASGYDLKVFNDKHAGVVAFYRCIRDWEKQLKLVERLELTPHAREEFIWARDTWKNCEDDVERAARWYYMLRVSFAQLGRNFGRSLNSTNMLAAKLHAALADFPMFHNIWKNIQVENLDVVQSMRDYDSGDTVHYIDPDYIGADTGIYENRVNHKMLMTTIRECRGFVAVSGYDNELYNSFPWDDKFQWDVTVAMTSQAFQDTNHLGDKANVMGRDKKAVETLWIKSSR